MPSLMYLVTFLLLLVVSAALILWPLTRRREPWTVATDFSEIARLLADEKRRLLRAVKDLAHEREAGTVSAAEEQEVRAKLMHDAAVLNRRMDELKRTTESTTASDRVEIV
ncbi:MAG: hypothetical protein ACKVX7_10575 [Planctomycetota bacterium]